MNQSRRRVSGILGESDRGPILTSEDGNVWVLDTEDPMREFLGKAVAVEGMVVGLDRLQVDWLGLVTQEAK